MDYYEIWNKMEWNKDYAAKDLSISPASLLAMERRGMVKKVAVKPNRYMKQRNKVEEIYRIVRNIALQHELDVYDVYFSVWNKDESMGMMCRCKNNTIVDCWDKVYDVSRVSRVLCKGKEVVLYE